MQAAGISEPTNQIGTTARLKIWTCPRHKATKGTTNLQPKWTMVEANPILLYIFTPLPNRTMKKHHRRAWSHISQSIQLYMCYTCACCQTCYGYLKIIEFRSFFAEFLPAEKELQLPCHGQELPYPSALLNATSPRGWSNKRCSCEGTKYSEGKPIKTYLNKSTL